MKVCINGVPDIRRITSVLYGILTAIILQFVLNNVPEYLQNCDFICKSISIIFYVCVISSYLGVICCFLDPSGENELYHAGLIFPTLLELVLLIYFLRTRVLGFEDYYIFEVDGLNISILLLGMWLLTCLTIAYNRKIRTLLFCNKFCEKSIKRDSQDFQIVVGTGMCICLLSILAVVFVTLSQLHLHHVL